MGLSDRYDEKTGAAQKGYENSIMAIRNKSANKKDIEDVIRANKPMPEEPPAKKEGPPEFLNGPSFFWDFADV